MRVAEHLGAEILSLDSMKIYRGMDIGTAKATRSERDRIPHHLVDVVDPHESFNVKRFFESADAAIADIRSRGRWPFLSGGTILYLKALLHGLSGPPSDPEIRERLKREAEDAGSTRMHERLREVDGEAADRIHPNDIRRIVRALEVHEMTGQPISSFQTDFAREQTRYDAVLVGIRRDRADLHHRIDARVEHMISDGLVEEVRAIREGSGFGREASQALGYKEILDHLEGLLSLDEARERICYATHQFARHQMTWLRRFPQIHWLDAEPDEPSESLAERSLGWIEPRLAGRTASS